MATTIYTDLQTASYFETVPLEDAKAHLRIEGNEFDSELEHAIAAAIDFCEHQTGRVLRVGADYATTMPGWDNLCDTLPWQPVSAIVGIIYWPPTGIQVAVNAADYRLVLSDVAAAHIETVDTFTQPAIAVREDAIVVRYTTGYATAADIPHRAKQAIKMMLTVFWGDLTPKEMELWTKQAKAILVSLDWGVYR